MNRGKLLILASLCGIFVSSYTSVIAANAQSKQPYDQKTLAQVEALYGLSEDAAVTRLAKEYDAAVQARRIEGHHLQGYAGSWFDSASQALQVATTDQADFSLIKRNGATPILVDHSFVALEGVRKNLGDKLTSAIGLGSIRESYIDVRSNVIVFGIAEAAMSRASAFMATSHADAPVRLTSVAVNSSGFSTNLHGADRTRNGTWPLTNGVRSPCSVGASAEEINGSSYTAGFATAGHCGSTGNAFTADDGTTALGTVMASTYDYSSGTESNNEDGAWVTTVSPWVPKAQINGYADGTLNVSGTWSGMLIAPVGTTVCRYGATSGGPYCGTVGALNVNYSPTGTITLHGMIKAHGICTEDGDSGGPLVTPANQVQGTDTGSGNTHSCSVNHSTFDVFFQPIGTTLSRANTSLGSNDVAMLTSHGRSAPTVAGMHCPDMANSGNYVYICDFSSFDSQGATTISWTTNTGASSDSTELSSHCSHGQTVNVALAVSNPYGTVNGNASFTCPSRPAP